MPVKFQSHRKQINAQMTANIGDNVQAAGFEFVRLLKRKLRGGKRSGIRYRKPGGTRGTYQASAPGEPPAPATGRLAESYTMVPQGRYSVLVGTPLKYARYLELGTRYISKRPHFKKTMRENNRAIRAKLKRKVA